MLTPPSSPERAPLFKGTPAVFALTRESLTMVFPLHRMALVRVEYGETEALGHETHTGPDGFVPRDDQVVKICLRGLSPGRRYYWRGVARAPGDTGEERTSLYHGHTLPGDVAETHFSVWNDTHGQAATIQKLHALRRAEDDFLLWNGDLSNDIDHREQLPGQFVHPAGVDLAEGPPILLARGNHDVHGLWAHKLTDYVAFPGERTFYAFRTGPVAVIVLDTGEHEPDTHESVAGLAAFDPLVREQTAWLEKTTQEPAFRDAPYRVVFCHIPMRWRDEFPDGYAKKGISLYSTRRGREAWADALKRWGAQIVISGHTHIAAWLPASAEFPFGQLIGGGPDVGTATILHADANAQNLTLHLKSLLNGETLEKIVVAPLSSHTLSSVPVRAGGRNVYRG